MAEYDIAKGTKSPAFRRDLNFEKHLADYSVEIESDDLAKRLLLDLDKAEDAQITFLGTGTYGLVYGVEVGNKRYAVKMVNGVIVDSEGLLGTWFKSKMWKEDYSNLKVPFKREGETFSDKESDPLLNVIDYRSVGKLTIEGARSLLPLLSKKIRDDPGGRLGVSKLVELYPSFGWQLVSDDATVGYVFELELADGDFAKLVATTADARVLAKEIRSMLFQIMTTLRKLDDFSGFVHGDLTLKNVFYLRYKKVGPGRTALIYKNDANEYRIEDEGDEALVFAMGDFGFSSLSNKNAIDAKSPRNPTFEAFSPDGFLRNHGADLHLLGFDLLTTLSRYLTDDAHLAKMHHLAETNAELVDIYKFCVERLLYSPSSLKNAYIYPTSQVGIPRVNFRVALRLFSERILEKNADGSAKNFRDMAHVLTLSYEQLEGVKAKSRQTPPPFTVRPHLDFTRLPVEAYEAVSENARYRFWKDDLFRSFRIEKEKKRSKIGDVRFFSPMKVKKSYVFTETAVVPLIRSEKNLPIAEVFPTW